MPRNFVRPRPCSWSRTSPKPLPIIATSSASRSASPTVIRFSTAASSGATYEFDFQAANGTRRESGQGAVNVFVIEVDALHDELKSRGATLVHPPGERPYGMRDFDIDDLDGNRLTFGMGIGGSD